MTSVDDVLYLAPQVSAGEGGTMAPQQMTQDQLMFQAKQLLGRDVVYTVRCFDGTHELRAGNLVELRDGLYMRNTERLKHLYNVRPWVGTAEQHPFPGEYNVIRMIAAHVHEAEVVDEKDREINRLIALVKTLETRCETLERQVHEQDRLIQLHQAPAVAGGGGEGSGSGGRAASVRTTDMNSVRHDSMASLHSYHSTNSPQSPGHNHNPFHGVAPSHSAGAVANDNHHAFPGSPSSPQTPANTPATLGDRRRWGNDIVIDMSFMHTAFGDREKANAEHWLAVLHKEEIRTIADLGKLTEHDWDRISLPIVVKRKLTEICRGAI